MPRITLHDQTGEQNVSSFWIGSGEEGVQYSLFATEKEGIEAEYAKMAYENENLKQQIQELKKGLDRNTTMLLRFLKEVNPLIQQELEIDEALSKLPRIGTVDAFSPEGNAWVFPEELINEYLE
jgi:hypothetical protein